MTVEELKKTGAVYIDNVVRGMKNFSHEMMVMDREEAEEKMRTLWKSAGEGNAFVDFYYFTLQEKERKEAEKYLSQDEILYLQEKKRESEPGEEHIIFELDEKLLKIATKMNEKQVLFSTFYFTGKEKSTWWGNYNREYIRFWE